MENNYFVSDIKEITKKKRLVYINEMPEFALYVSEIRKYNIKINEIIDDSTYSAIVDDLLSKRSKARMMFLLQAKDYTEYEMRKKLGGDYYPESCIEASIKFAKEQRYIDDYRYANTYANFKMNSKSRKQIELFLYSKGIDKGIISQACDEVYEDNDGEEVKLAVKLLFKKKVDYTSLTYEEKNKIMGTLYRRGFGSDVISKALDIVSETCENTTFS